jgi:hypothetical protein
VKTLLKFIFSDPKTSSAAVVGAIAAVCAHFNIVLPPEWAQWISLATVSAIGILAKDGKGKPPAPPAVVA